MCYANLVGMQKTNHWSSFVIFAQEIMKHSYMQYRPSCIYTIIYLSISIYIYFIPYSNIHTTIYVRLWKTKRKKILYTHSNSSVFQFFLYTSFLCARVAYRISIIPLHICSWWRYLWYQVLYIILFFPHWIFIKFSLDNGTSIFFCVFLFRLFK